MILYFSGTGNSRFIAERIAAHISDAIVSMNDRIRRHDASPIDAGDQLIIVTPTYAWRIPRIVEEWLRGTELRGAKRAWFVMNCGSEIGDADRYLKALCADKGLEYMGVFEIVMPENYIAMFNAPDKEKAKQIIDRAEVRIGAAADLIQKGDRFPAPRRNLYDRIMSAAINPVFYRAFVKAKAFYTSDACIGCGKCARLCPLCNIKIKNGKPLWGEHCTHCMACICHCPAEAIEYGKKSIGKPRYHID